MQACPVEMVFVAVDEVRLGMAVQRLDHMPQGVRLKHVVVVHEAHVGTPRRGDSVVCVLRDGAILHLDHADALVGIPGQDLVDLVARTAGVCYHELPTAVGLRHHRIQRGAQKLPRRPKDRHHETDERRLLLRKRGELPALSRDLGIGDTMRLKPPRIVGVCRGTAHASTRSV